MLTMCSPKAPRVRGLSSNLATLINSVALITWRNHRLGRVVFILFVVALVVSIQLLSSVSLLRDHTVVFVDTRTTVPSCAGVGGCALSVGHWRASLFLCFVNYLYMIDIVDKVGVYLHLITMLVYFGISLVPLRLLSAVSLHMVNIVLLFIHFVFLIFNSQLAARVSHTLNGYPRWFFVYLWVIIDWPFVRRLFLLIWNWFVPDLASVAIVFVF
jgi:hypothetical protein